MAAATAFAFIRSSSLRAPPSSRWPAPKPQVCVVGDLVALAPARERSAPNAVLRPAAAGADADVPVEPRRPVGRADPAQPPVGSAGGVQIGRPREAAERAPQGEAIGPG